MIAEPGRLDRPQAAPRHEPTDAKVRAIVTWGLFLLAAVVLMYLGTAGLAGLFLRARPAEAGSGGSLGLPELKGPSSLDELAAIRRETERRERAVLDGTAGAGPGGQGPRISIEQAMRFVAEHGLPRPSTAAAGPGRPAAAGGERQGSP